MARGRSIIVGGGMGTTGALAVGAFLSVALTDPPTAQISPFLGEVASGVIIAAGRVDPQGAATEVLRVKGGVILEGAGADSVLVGRGATAAHQNAVVVGLNAASTANNAIVIGFGASGGGVAIGASCTTPANSGWVNIGGTIVGSTGTGGGVCIKGSLTTFGGNQSVAILGTTAGSFSIAIGGATGTTNGATMVGSGGSITSGLTNVTAIGAEAEATRSGQIVLGGFIFSQQVTELLVGSGETIANPAGLLFRMTNASGANNASGNLTIRGSLSTGNAAPGKVILSVGLRVAGSSSTLQTAYNHLTLDSTATDSLTILNTPSGRNSRLHFTLDDVAHGIIGVAGAAGGIVTGATAGDLVIRSVTQDILFTTDGTTIPLYLGSAGTAVVMNKDRVLRFDNHTTATGAQAGTLGNAPTVGNPAFWLKISIAGTNYAIPCWQG